MSQGRKTKTFDDIAVGDVTAQGDLYFVCIAALPASAKPRTNRQLAEGTTMGSRHTIASGDVYDCDAGEAAAAIKAACGVVVEAQYIGPVFTGPAYIEHPEHGHHDYRCACVMVTVYQRSLDAEERAARVID